MGDAAYSPFWLKEHEGASRAVVGWTCDECLLRGAGRRWGGGTKPSVLSPRTPDLPVTQGKSRGAGPGWAAGASSDAAAAPGAAGALP